MKTILVDINTDKTLTRVPNDANLVKGEEIVIPDIEKKTCKICNVVYTKVFPVEKLRIVFCKVAFNGIDYSPFKGMIESYEKMDEMNRLGDIFANTFGEKES